MSLLVVPAHAGVILVSLLMLSTLKSGSRTRGGDPAKGITRQLAVGWFPHTRG